MSPLTGCQVTSRPHDRFSRYSKRLDTSQTDLVKAINDHLVLWKSKSDLGIQQLDFLYV